MSIRYIPGLFLLHFLIVSASPVLAADPAEVTPGLNLVPWPKSVKVDQGQLAIGQDTRVVASDDSLKPLATVLADELKTLTGLRITAAAGAAKPGDIVLRINSTLKADEPFLIARPPEIVRTTDGAHTITINDQAVVEGFDYRAVAEGTSTLLQALQQRDGGYALPKLTIKDWPHADYMAMMIDVARQDHSPEVLKKMIEVMRLYRVRYVHLHMTDDQGWTFPSTKYPQLGTKNQVVGHAGPNGVAPRRYKLEDLKDLVAFAAARGMAIVPEFEMPGHSGAALRSFPEVFDAINPATGQPVSMGCMNMTNEELYKAIDTIIGEMCEVFYTSPYFHIGSDEVFAGRVNLNPGYKDFMKAHNLKDDYELETYFVRTVNEMVKKRGKKTIKWEGMANGASKDIVVMTWVKASPVARDLLDQGFSTITVPWDLEVPWDQWNMYVANGARLKKGDSVIGASLVAWEQSEEFQLNSVRNVGARQERTWGPDNTPTVGGFAQRFRASDAVALKLIGRGPELKLAGTFDAPAGHAGWQAPAFAVDGSDETFYLAGRPFKAGETFTYKLDKPTLLYSIDILTGVNNKGLFSGDLQIAEGGEFRTVATFDKGAATAKLEKAAVTAIRLKAASDQADPLALRELKMQVLTQLAGAVPNPNKAIGDGNVGLLTADTTFGPQFSADLPVIVNGQLLRFDSGGGNALAYGGAIMGAGKIEVMMGPGRGGFAKSALTLSGKDANTFNGSFTVKQGVVKLAKDEKVDALAGDITVGGQGENDAIVWTKNHQINDAARVTLLSVPAGTATLNLNGCADAFDSLTLAAGCRVQTDGERKGGVLSVAKVTVDGQPIARGVYATPTPWVVGSGYVVVGEVKTIDIAGKVASPGQTVGAGNFARLTGLTTFTLDAAGFDSPINLNGEVLTLTTEAEQSVRVAAFITGNGGLEISKAKSPIELAGEISNTYVGPTRVLESVVKLGKAAGLVAVTGDLTISGSGGATWAADGQIADDADVKLLGDGAPYLDLAGHKAAFMRLTLTASAKVRLGEGGKLKVRQLNRDGKLLPAGEYTSADQPWIEGSGSVTVDPKVDIKGAYGNPNVDIGAGLIGNLTGNTKFIVSVGDCDIDILTNGHKFTLDSGDGNPLCYRGAIQGTGDIEFRMGPSYTGYKDAPLRLAGPKANTTTGKFLAVKGRVQLEKPDGVDAISGDVTVGGQGFNDCLHWKASNQIKDTVNITMKDTKNSGAAYLSLNGCQETAASLTMTAFNTIKTDGPDGQGGVLTVKSLTIAGQAQPAGEYTAATAKWIEGAGKVIVRP